METVRLIRERSIRFLFLGNVETDRRVKNFIRFFQSRQWYTELICSTKDSVSHLEEVLNVRVHQLNRIKGPLMFYEHHQYLKNQLGMLPATDVVCACELYSLPAARYAKTHHKARLLAYDAREVYTGLPTVVGKPLSHWFWKRTEHKGLQETDAVIVTGALDAGAIEKVHRMLPRSFLIRNIPMRAQSPAHNTYLRQRFQIPEHKSIIVYVGGIQRDRGLGQMASAMHALKDKAVFILIGDGELKAGLLSVIHNAGLTDSVYFHEPIPSDRVLDILASADIGVSLVDTDAPSYALALPSKMYEYLFAGLPVLASPMKQAVTEFGSHQAIRFVKLHDEKAIIDNTNELIALAKDKRLMEKLQNEAIETYSFEHDAERFAQFLENRL